MTKKLKMKALPVAPQPTAGASSTWMPFGAPINEIVLALGLGGLIFMRPWIDGLTYPEKNTYFAWIVSGLFALWSARLFLRKEDLRYPIHITLLGVFVFIAFATGFASVQFDATYRSLLNWASYLMIFAMAASGLRSPAAVAVILGFFVLTSFAETIWSILHINYLMPLQREALKDPEQMRLYFDTTEMTPEIRSRIESNRAMGSLLFANALACWILVAIPFAIGGAVHAFLRLRETVPSPADEEPRKDTRALVLGMLVGMGSFIAIAVFYSFYFAFEFMGRSWTDHPVRWTLYCVIIPSAVGAFTFRAVHRSGTRRVLLRIQCAVLAALAILQCVGLAQTYSRGGMLATAAALALGGALVWYGGKLSCIARTGAVAALVLLAALSGFNAINDAAWAQEAPPAEAADTNVELQGVNPSLDAMMNPATAFLRLSYWQSGLEMFLANPWTGVGLGNFGTVYPKYQLPNSADVKQAHND
ncbi:MAG: O-antigen ligase family protein, partial [Candidatus Hydrogenedentes bacterium]|nr:O-antigen ligase family protein [Candidatus Hydrogenedentota bacterium]